MTHGIAMMVAFLVAVGALLYRIYKLENYTDDLERDREILLAKIRTQERIINQDPNTFKAISARSARKLHGGE